jgi:hypothetical protein
MLLFARLDGLLGHFFRLLHLIADLSLFNQESARDSAKQPVAI